MFDFIRKKKTDPAEIAEPSEDKRKSENNSSNIGAGYAATQTAHTMAQKADQKYEKADTYTGNRTLYDSGAAKVNAKKNLFGSGNEVIDPYTGDKLVLTKQEAKMLYGDDWAKHLAESDHVKPLEKIYNDTKSRQWNTIDDIKAAANSSDNIRVASRKFNNPKRSRTNKEYVEKKVKGLR